MRKNVRLLAALVLSLPSPAAAQARETGFLDRTATVDGHAYRYQVYVPRDYDPARQWPVILFLHGAGERGSDGLLQTDVGLGSAVRRDPDRYPAIIVFPQTPADSIWQGFPARVAMAALDQTVAEFNTDPAREYLTGLSLGGNGAWYLAYQNADRFAAVAVVCGFVSGRRSSRSFMPSGEGTVYERYAERLMVLPVWIVHGADDSVVPVTESQQMFKALTAAGADVHYVELPGVDHNSWDPAYRTPELAEWLFTQRRAGDPRPARD